VLSSAPYLIPGDSISNRNTDRLQMLISLSIVNCLLIFSCYEDSEGHVLKTIHLINKLSVMWKAMALNGCDFLSFGTFSPAGIWYRIRGP
jgi:hypothetical protein